MPDNWQVQNNGFSTSSNASADNLKEAMWRMTIQIPDNQDGVAGHLSPFPDRPGEPDCIYYLRTGLCGYGSNCRFNHPVYPGQVSQYRGELPERVGQPDCKYFLKTGTCKFGATCKFHHPRDRPDTGQVPLNILGLPMREEEKSCPYYMQTGSCKFGTACKFHHPQPANLGAVLPMTGPATFGSTGSSVVPSSGLSYMGGFPAWSLPRAPYISGPRREGPHAYMPVVLSPSQGVIAAQQGWNTYTGIMSPASPTNVFGSNIVNSKHQGEPGSSGQVHLLSTSFPHFPERPDQPKCEYFLKTGSCRFGPSCKFHHPKERIAPLATSTLGPLGLPLRPGQTICTFYSLYGICKYGPTCKYDHPLAGYSYNYNVSLPTLSIPDQPLFPYQRNSPNSRLSETYPTKSLRLPDHIKKPNAASHKHQDQDAKPPEDPAQQATSPTHTSTSSEPRHNQSD
ncbi:hypothetical protein HHK36_003324 [Tetracentron sinense]|uniref:C3H1-type domain-containing protein n=1 Tax=Tetracentron sinense TaxID=13715 RepID=A0A834ZQY1_TETSI|nr:hypothetical protein HHK36_003324 [Tetracentron sinense]